MVWMFQKTRSGQGKKGLSWTTGLAAGDSAAVAGAGLGQTNGKKGQRVVVVFPGIGC